MNPIITLENAFAIAVESLYCGDDLTSISISDDFTLEICLHGETWDGLLDYRVGEFLTTLQKDVFTIYNKATHNNVSLRSKHDQIEPLTVKVSVKKKCLSLRLFFKFLTKIAPYMKSEDLAKVLIAASIVAGFSFYQHVERDKAISTEQIHAKANVELARIESNERIQKAIASSQVDLVKEVREAVVTSIDSAISAQNHKAVIAKHMAKEDKLQIDGVNLTKDNAKNLFTPPKSEIQSVTTSHYIDGTYPIKSVSFEEHQISLDVEGKVVKALTKFLDEKTKKQLYDIYKQADLENRVPKASLWLVAEIKGYELVETAVTGIGTKRPDSKKLHDLLTPKQKIKKQPPKEQLKLF